MSSILSHITGASSKTFNVAVIGYGFSAKVFHIPFIQQVPSLHFYGIVQRSPKPDNDASKDYSGIKSWRSTDEMLKDADVDVVVITTFPDSHFEFTKVALEAGKHVVVEKPWVDTEKEARELIEIQKKSGKLMTIFQNRRWDSDFLTVKKLIDDKSLGRLVEFESHFDRFRPDVPTTAVYKNYQSTASCAGCVYDLGTHLMDQVVTLFGLPKTITAALYNQRETESVNGDSFTILLRYADGLIATCKAAVLSSEKEQLRFWVRGDKGSFKKWHEDLQEVQLKEKRNKPGDNDFGVDPESHHGVLTQTQNGEMVEKRFPTVEPLTYTEFYRIFAKALAGQGEVPVQPSVARDVIRLVELAKESSRKGQTLDV